MAAIERKRPWYLVLSLLAALAFGANGARSGWATVMLYHEPIDPSMAGHGIADEADRAAVVARVEAYVHALDAARAQGWPLSIAKLLLGGATLFFAMRAMAGSRGARAALVQLVIAQAAVAAASHWLLRDVDDAELRWIEAQQAAGHERVPEEMLRSAALAALALQMLGSGLIVLGLTRRRSRDFFEPAPAAVGEQ
ncbi:MAG TPA: hypothetical protein VN894_04105 [Polyangiaceae bacterium]|nr:hypothetical protein [Polyangiaceae bacterium]